MPGSTIAYCGCYTRFCTAPHYLLVSLAHLVLPRCRSVGYTTHTFYASPRAAHGCLSYHTRYHVLTYFAGSHFTHGFTYTAHILRTPPRSHYVTAFLFACHTRHRFAHYSPSTPPRLPPPFATHRRALPLPPHAGCGVTRTALPHRYLHTRLCAGSAYYHGSPLLVLLRWLDAFSSPGYAVLRLRVRRTVLAAFSSSSHIYATFGSRGPDFLPATVAVSAGCRHVTPLLCTAFYACLHTRRTCYTPGYWDYTADAHTCHTTPLFHVRFHVLTPALPLGFLERYAGRLHATQVRTRSGSRVRTWVTHATCVSISTRATTHARFTLRLAHITFPLHPHTLLRRYRVAWTSARAGLRLFLPRFTPLTTHLHGISHAVSLRLPWFIGTHTRTRTPRTHLSFYTRLRSSSRRPSARYQTRYRLHALDSIAHCRVPAWFWVPFITHLVYAHFGLHTRLPSFTVWLFYGYRTGLRHSWFACPLHTVALCPHLACGLHSLLPGFARYGSDCVGFFTTTPRFRCRGWVLGLRLHTAPHALSRFTGSLHSFPFVRFAARATHALPPRLHGPPYVPHLRFTGLRFVAH